MVVTSYFQAAILDSNLDDLSLTCFSYFPSFFFPVIEMF